LESSSILFFSRAPSLHWYFRINLSFPIVPYRDGTVEDYIIKPTSSLKENMQLENLTCSESSPLIPANPIESMRKGSGLKICFRFLWAGNSPFTFISVMIMLIGIQGCNSGLDMTLSILSRAMGNHDIWWTQFYLSFYAGLFGLGFLLGLIRNLLFYYLCVSASRHLTKLSWVD